MDYLEIKLWKLAALGVIVFIISFLKSFLGK